MEARREDARLVAQRPRHPSLSDEEQDNSGEDGRDSGDSGTNHHGLNDFTPNRSANAGTMANNPASNTSNPRSDHTNNG